MNRNSHFRDLMAFMPLIPVFFLISNISNLQKALVSVITIYTFYVLITEKWINRKNLGFWVIIALFAVTHAIIIYNLRLESRISPAMMLLPLIVVDFFAMYYAIGLYEKSLVARDKV